MSCASATTLATAKESSEERESENLKLDKSKENTGRWLTEEHEIFLRGLDEHGKQWKKIALMIQTRSVVQVRTHAQKYFQKLMKNDKVPANHPHRMLSGSTAVSKSGPIPGAGAACSPDMVVPMATVASPSKRKNSKNGSRSKGEANKKRRVSLEPKPTSRKYGGQGVGINPHHRLSLPSQYSYAAPLLPSALPPQIPQHQPSDDGAIDPSFIQTLKMAADEGELDDSLLDLLDDSSVEAVEQVIGPNDDDDDAVGEEYEPNPVSPSASSVSLAENPSTIVAVEPVTRQEDHHLCPQLYSGSVTDATITRTVSVMTTSRQDVVSSPNPSEDFTIHDTIGTAEQELSPTTVTCTMDIKDFEQKTASALAHANGQIDEDALDWLMDDGWRQLPASAGEVEEDWSGTYSNVTSSGGMAPKLPLSAGSGKNTVTALSAIKETNVV